MIEKLGKYTTRNIIKIKVCFLFACRAAASGKLVGVRRGRVWFSGVAEAGVHCLKELIINAVCIPQISGPSCRLLFLETEKGEVTALGSLVTYTMAKILMNQPV